MVERKKAQGLHSVEQLLEGVADKDWRIRFESVDRLAARWHDDRRTLPALLELAEHDPAWQVRARGTMRLVDFDRDAVVPIARRGLSDPSADVMVTELRSLPVRLVEFPVRDTGRSLVVRRRCRFVTETTRCPREPLPE
jgi:HEAT repeats